MRASKQNAILFRVRRLVIQALLILAIGGVALPAMGQERFREIPGVREFTGQMIVRPLQPGHWRERGFSDHESRGRHEEATQWLCSP